MYAIDTNVLVRLLVEDDLHTASKQNGSLHPSLGSAIRY